MKSRASRCLRTVLAASLLAQAGCSAASRPNWLQEPGWNKPWTYRSGVAAAVCAAIGAGAGVGVQQARTSCATVTSGGQVVSKSCSSISNANDGTFWVWGALIGAASGALLCGVLGHVFLDPAEPGARVMPPPLLEPTSDAADQPPTGAAAAAAAPLHQRIVLRGVNFDFNSDAIGMDSRPVLEQGAELLKENPGVTVQVEGYTDSIGSEAYNQELSLRRAETVYRYLVNLGIDPQRLRVEGFGESHPVADNDTESGRARNRRVELHPEQTAPSQ